MNDTFESFKVKMKAEFPDQYSDEQLLDLKSVI